MMRTTIIFAAILLVVACKSKQTDIQIEAHKWEAEKIKGETVMAENSRNIFIEFKKEDTSVSGKASCNRFFGKYELNGEKITFSQMGSTKMACMNMELEALFLKTLEETTAFRVKDGKLVLMNGEEELAVLTKSVE